LCFAVFSLRFVVIEGIDPIWQRFVAHGQHFCAVVAIDRTTMETTRNDADQRKTNQTPHPVARDGSGIPVPRVYKMACVPGSIAVQLRWWGGNVSSTGGNHE
jgi:hypothetical protein